MSEHIEVHESGDWAAVYLNGKIALEPGDAYHADEWLRTHFGVVTVQDDAYLRGGNGREGFAETLAEVANYAAIRQSKRDRAASLRAEAARLEAEAGGLDE